MECSVIWKGCDKLTVRIMDSNCAPYMSFSIICFFLFTLVVNSATCCAIFACFHSAYLEIPRLMHVGITDSQSNNLAHEWQGDTATEVVTRIRE